MPLNLPAGQTQRLSFGPARVFLGASGSTPTTEIGYIATDNGVTIEVSNELKDVLQGNPKMIEYTFSMAQGIMVKVTSIEWDWTRLARAIGSGVTTSGGGQDTFDFGGDPLVNTVALHVQHQMPVSGNTMDIYVWKAVTEAPPNLPFTHDEHAFELSFKAQRAATSWDGASLPYNQQLIRAIETT